MTTSMVKMKQRGSRRKQSEEDSMEFFEVPSGFEFSKPPSSTQRNNNIAPHTLPPPVTVMTRQPTAKEAALSAKNYRLAKELSDMRVRHREECQKSSRLTMENMNLASRCREAISHVAMLQRELAMYQQRDAEAIALQRQQTKRFASSLSDRQQFRANDTTRDALPVPPKKSVSPIPPSSMQKQGIKKRINDRTPPASRLSSATSSSEMDMASSDDDTLETSRDESFQSSLVSPASSPDKTINDSSSYTFTPSPDSQYSTPSKRDTPLHISPKRCDGSSPVRIIPLSPSRGHRRATSLDAFEASFATTFPSNFHSPAEEEEQSQSSTKADVYDPFSTFASPSPMAAVVRHAQVDTSPDLEGQLPKPANLDPAEKLIITPIVSWDDDEEVSCSSSFSTPPRQRPTVDEPNENEPPKTPAKTPSVEARAKYENAMAPAKQQNTPPLRRRPPKDKSMDNETSKTPAKTQSAEARSKYDFALQPTRTKIPSSSSMEGSDTVPAKDRVGLSPLLQRIQQKRNQKKLNRQHSEPSSTVPKPDFRRYSSAPESRTVVEGTTPMVAPENRDHAGSSEEEATSRSSRRRNVKQPLSYAEPALNTKIRKGHVFFQKDSADDAKQ